MTGRSTLRSAYRTALKDLRRELTRLQAKEAVALSAATAPRQTSAAPDFAALAPDPVMAAILERRWRECWVCLSGGAPTAAAVMMGGLLEGTLLARIALLGDKTPVFTANAAPRDKANRKARPLSQWRLKDLLAVARELGWITGAMHQLGGVVRDYRNFIHPEREYVTREALRLQDAEAMWDVCQHVLRELLAPARGGAGS